MSFISLGSFVCNSKTALGVPFRLGHVFVQQVDARPGGADPLDLGDQVGQLLGGLHLLLEVLALEKVGHLRVATAVGHLVQFQERLIHGLLEVQRVLGGVQGVTPLRLGGFLDVLEDHLAAAHVLVIDQLLGVLALLVGRFAEKLGKAWQGLIFAVKEGALKIRFFFINDFFFDEGKWGLTMAK